MNTYSEVQMIHMSGMAIILFFSIVGMIYFILNKDKSYLFYSVNLALTLFGISAGFYATTGEFIKPTPFEGFIGVLVYPVFTIFFLNLDRRSVLYKICVFLPVFIGSYILINFVLELFLTPLIIEQIYGIVALICLLIWLYALRLVSKRKDIISRLFLIGTTGTWLFLGVTNVLFILNVPFTGIWDNPYIYSVFAFVWDAVWFSANLAYRTNMIKKENVLLMEKNFNFERQKLIDQDMIAADMYDDLGTKLSALSFTAELAKLKSSDMQMKNEYDKIITMSSDMTEYLKEIMLITNQKNNSIASMISFMNQYTIKISEEKKITVNFNIPKHIPDKTLTSITRKKLFLAYKKLLSEVICIAKNSEICVDFDLLHNFNIRIISKNKDLKSLKLEMLDKFETELIEVKKMLYAISADFKYQISGSSTLNLIIRLEINNIDRVDNELHSI